MASLDLQVANSSSMTLSMGGGVMQVYAAKTGDQGIQGPQGPPGPGTGAGAWQPTTGYTANQVVQAPDGSIIYRIANGTSRASFDATEAALWAANSTRVGTIEQAAQTTSFAPDRVTDSGALKNDSHDDAPAIQALINQVRDAIRAGFATANNLVRLPGGVYKLGSTLEIPPYVKFQLDGMVVFRYTGTNTALFIAPQTSDPTSVYAPMKKQQWSNPPIFQGGGLVVLRDGSDTPANWAGVGIELGSQSDLGASKPMKGYRLGNVSISGFAVGVQLNTYNHYLGSFENVHVELNTIGVAYGIYGTPVINSGENFKFDHCIFAGANSAIRVAAPGWDATFVACSIDYCDRAFTVRAGYGRIAYQGGHIEAITPYSDTPLYGSYIGGVVVSDSGDDATVTFDQTTFLVEASDPIFRGTNLTVAGTIHHRPAGDVTNPGGLRMAESAVWCPDLRNVYRPTRRIVTELHNRIADPKFIGETVGTTSAGSLVNWDVPDASSATFSIISGGYDGGKAMRVTLPAGAYFILRDKREWTVRDLGERHATLILKPGSVGVASTAFAYWYDRAGAETTTDGVAMASTTLPAGAWGTPLYVSNVAPTKNLAAVRGVKPAFVVSNPTGSTITVDIGYAYFGL